MFLCSYNDNSNKDNNNNRSKESFNDGNYIDNISKHYSNDNGNNND